MIVGFVQDNLPWIPFTLPSLNGTETIEFVLDTGFQGDLALPPRYMDRVAAGFVYRAARTLADGSRRQCDVYEMKLEWEGDIRTIEILCLDGKPLVGTLLLDGSQITVDLRQGGEVIVEFG